MRVNTSAVERRAATLVDAEDGGKKDWQIAWLLRAITCMDLTTLSGDDTDERVSELRKQKTDFARNRGESPELVDWGYKWGRCPYVPLVRGNGPKGAGGDGDSSGGGVDRISGGANASGSANRGN